MPSRPVHVTHKERRYDRRLSLYGFMYASVAYDLGAELCDGEGQRLLIHLDTDVVQTESDTRDATTQQTQINIDMPWHMSHAALCLTSTMAACVCLCVLLTIATPYPWQSV